MTTARARRHPRALLAGGVLSAAALLAGACGLSEDGSPEVIAADNVPFGLLDAQAAPATTAPPTAGSSTVTVFFIEQADDGSTVLRPTEREVSDPGSVRDRVQALLDQPPTSDETDTGLSTAIPSGTVLTDVVQTAGDPEVVIELSAEFVDGVQGQGQRAAFAQITCTATENVPGVARVRFHLEDEGPLGALVADGTVRDGPVSCRQDYLNRLPNLPRDPSVELLPETMTGESADESDEDEG